MTNKTQIHFKKLSEILPLFGCGKSTFYQKINNGLICPPVSLGERAVGYLAHEVDSVLQAMAAGKSQVEIKKIVQRLVDSREGFCEEVTHVE